jgi:hypothetical protein
MQVTINPDIHAHNCRYEGDRGLCTVLVLGDRLFQAVLYSIKFGDIINTDIYLFPIGATVLESADYISQQGEYLITGVESKLSNLCRSSGIDTLTGHNAVVHLFTDLIVGDDQGLLSNIKTDLSMLYRRL